MRVLQITDVKMDRQASFVGIHKDDYLLTYDGKPINSDDSLSEAINSNTKEEVIVVIYRNKDEMEFTVKAGPLGISTRTSELDVDLIEAAKSVLLTTAHTVEGFKLRKTHDIVTSECVYGMNIFKDILASFTDVIGGRSGASQKVLKDLKETCLRELRYEAALLGANAIIAVDLDYSEFSGGGKSMLFLVASGTAVTIEPIIGY
jgi:uncharacterized protein YbjQ (UPF0145 family)